MDYEAMQEKLVEAEQKTKVQKTMRETRQALEAAEVAEGVAERKLQKCREHRRIAQWRLRALEGIEEEVEEYGAAE